MLGKAGQEPATTLKGSELVGAQVPPPARRRADTPEGKHSVVVAGDFVTAEDGSGIVHMAPAFGSDDYAVGQREGLAFLNPVAPDGTFSGTTWPEIEGRLVTADRDQRADHPAAQGRWPAPQDRPA